MHRPEHSWEERHDEPHINCVRETVFRVHVVIVSESRDVITQCVCQILQRDHETHDLIDHKSRRRINEDERGDNETVKPREEVFAPWSVEPPGREKKVKDQKDPNDHWEELFGNLKPLEPFTELAHFLVDHQVPDEDDQEDRTEEHPAH